MKGRTAAVAEGETRHHAVKGRITPPTLAQLEFLGVFGLRATCGACGCATRVRFRELELAASTRFSEVADLRQFACQVCGSSAVKLSPDWDSDAEPLRRS